MGTSTPDLVSSVKEHGNVLFDLTESLERPDLSQRVREEGRRWNDSRVVAVVAGDIKRGKSSLINALVGVDRLLPVDADVATTVRLLVQWAPELNATVMLEDANAPATRQILPGELADYASALGPAERRQGVAGVDVGVPSDLLRRGLCLLDTPGIGGLTPGHRDVTMACFGLADALVFTMAGDAPILLSEMEFLADAVERVDTVLLLLTKIDAEQEWPRLQSENTERLKRYADRLREDAAAPGAPASLGERARRFRRLAEQPLLPVSARRAIRAIEQADAGRTDAAAQTYERSGLGEVTARLERLGAQRETLRMRNVVQLSASITAALASDQQQRIRSAEQDPDGDWQIAREQAELAELASKQARWRQRLGYQIQAVQMEAQRVVQREFAQIEDRYRDEIQAGHSLADLADDLHQSVLAVWSTVAGGIATGLAEAVTSVGDELGVAGLTVPLDELTPPETVSAIEAVDPSTGRPGFDWVDDGVPMVLSTTAMAGLAFSLGLAGPPGWIAGGLLAGALGFARFRKRAIRYSTQEEIRDLREALAAMRQDCVATIGARMLALRIHIEDTIEERLGVLQADLLRRRTVLEALKRESQGRRNQAKADAKKQLSAINAVRITADQLRARIDAELGR